MLRGDLHNLDSESNEVRNWMYKVPYTARANDSIKDTAKALRERNADCIPVLGDSMNPIGIITDKILLEAFLQGKENESILQYMSKEDFCIIRSDESLLDIYKLPNHYFLVIDENKVLIGMLTRNEILKGFSSYIDQFTQHFHTSEILDIILESAYEGVSVVDKDGVLVEFNEAYSRFTGVAKRDAIGQPVQEVIDNTNLHNTVKTGMPERGAIQYIQGQPMVVHRIPLWKEGELVGAVGLLIFEGVTELYRIYDRFLEKTVQNAQAKGAPLQTDIVKTRSIEQIIGTGEQIANLKRMTRKIAKTDAAILITGESGTGKEMFANSIHDLSHYNQGPFISVNCGAIPEQLFESELFGYEEGAFTGAKKGGKPGKFELAESGTIFLDEIGEMPQMMQTKLLRILQERAFERVGGVQKLPLKARVVAATNKNLRSMVKAGTFREDLFYRINVIDLEIPPLRERSEDIPLLISHYLTETCNKYGVGKKEITAEALSAFMTYEWYGNIRELANIIEKLVILAEGDKIDIEHLPGYIKTRYDSSLLSLSPIDQVKREENTREKEMIVQIMKESGWNKSKAADKLGIHRTTLYKKLKKHGLGD
ncbi:sigma-54-dependent Fis family transcriptional regulator [Oceanobacillus massiliensis]|uniref:sigma-54-dependent Fis family transcriptional regulator n=1 Tax=Oceanobacillus massiliensis TaxID=1465765 RepID=UPI0002898755|nr:sigma-54-dependent Fis family transcriptional regulator [Oceanobacillus massiliensis]